MANQNQMRLCGGTFLVLLLESRGQRRYARMGNGRVSDGKSEPEVFEKLIRTVIPDFQKPSTGRTFNTFTSSYKLCKQSDSPTAPLTDPRVVNNYNAEIINNYSDKLSEFSEFLDNSFDLDTNGRWLVAALLDLIEADESIPDNAEFFILPNGESVNKDMLSDEDRYYISAFLMGVWHYIITHVKDNAVGKYTIDTLLPQKMANAERHFNRSFGAERSGQITVHTDIYYGTSHSCKKSPSPQRLAKLQKESAKTVKPLYKSDRLCQETERMILQGSESIINLNDGQGFSSLKATPNTIYQFRADYQFETKIAPDRTRQTLVSFSYDGVRYSGFTTAKNWESQSTMNNIVSAGKHLCTAWFYFFSLDAGRAVVQFLMIGEGND